MQCLSATFNDEVANECGAGGELGAGTSRGLRVSDFTGTFRSWIPTHVWADVTCQGQEIKTWWESRGSDSRDLPGGRRSAGVASLC